MKLQYLGYFNELETDKKSLVEHITLTLMLYLINFSGMKKLYYLRISFIQGKHETKIFGIFQ